MKKNFISKKVFSFLAMGLLLANFGSAQTNIVIEAENADVFHFATTSGRSGFSGGTGVDMKSTTNGYARYNVNVETEGTYNLTIAYATMNTRSCYLQINSQKPSLLVFDDFTTDWNTSDKSKNMLIYLEAGNNVIELGAYEYGTMQYAPAIDKLTITDASETIEKPAERVTPIVVEAESNNASLKTGNATATASFTGFASGSGAKVGDGEQNRGSLTYENITVAEAGTYDIIWYYASMQTRGIYIKVNSQKPVKSVMIESSNSWGDLTPADVTGENGENAHSADAPITLAKIEQVYLEAGNNTIILASLTDPSVDNGPNLDRFVIKSSPKTIAKNPELFKAYAADYTDIRTRVAESVVTSDENLKRLFDNNENTFYTSTVPVQVEIELPYPVIVQSYGLAVGEGYDAGNVTIERWHGTNWMVITGSTELRSPSNGQSGVTQPEVTSGTMKEYTTWLGTANKDRAGTKYRISFAGENISVGEFQINGFPYAGPDDYYFPVDLTRDVDENLLGSWSWDQKGWGSSDGSATGEGIAWCWDRKIGNRWTAESGKAYVEFNFNTPTEVKSYSIITREGTGDRGRNPRNWTLRGYTSDEDATGVELDFQYGVDWNRLQESVSVDRNQNMIFVIVNPGIYKRYRINFTQSLNNSSNVHAKELQFLPNVAPADKYPTVTTLAASDIGQTSAQLNSTLTTRADAVTEQGYKWRDKITAGEWQTSAGGVLTGLTGTVTYEFYAYAITEEGHIFTGETLEFETITYTNDPGAAERFAEIYTRNGNIVVISQAENTKVTVYNMIGQMYSFGVANGKLEIPVSSGIYIVHLNDIAKKVIVQ